MDYLAKLHWDALVAQKVDPTSTRAKEAIDKFHAALDRKLDSIFQPHQVSSS